MKFFLSLFTLTATSLSLLAQPVITTPPTNQVLAAGAMLSLSVLAGGTAPLAYQWFKDGRQLIGATNSTLSVTNANVLQSGSYFVVVTNAGGMVISYPVLVAVGNPCLMAWGDDGAGNLGNGISTNIQSTPVVIATNVVTGTAGEGSSLFVTADTRLWEMGIIYYNGTNVITNRPVVLATNVVAVAAGWSHVLFLKNDGMLWALGNNRSGELGNGLTNNTLIPVTVASNVVTVAAGYEHSLFVTKDGTLWGMGWNGFGQLGNGTNTGLTPNPTPLRITNNVVVVAAGFWHSLFLKTDGTLWATGNNYYGQLGTYDYPKTDSPVNVASNVTAMAAGWNSSLFVNRDGTLFATGENSYGQLGTGSAGTVVTSNVLAVAAGEYHSLFIKTNGTLWAMGLNNSGELGDGTTNNSATPVSVLRVSAAAIFPEDEAFHSLATGIQLPALANFTARRTSPQQMKLQLTGTPNYSYILQAATNLASPINWQPVLTNAADTNGNWTTTVSNFAAPRQFYRATAQ